MNWNTMPAPEPYLNDSPEMRAAARLQLEQIRQAKAKAESEKDRVAQATKSPMEWLLKYTKTYNPHWIEEQRPTPYEPFPNDPYFSALFELFELERVSVVEKSRDMMASWACVGYLTHQAMTTKEREIVFQTQKEKKVKQLIKYAKCLYENQPEWLKEAFPLARPINKQSDLALEFQNGSVIFGIPGGADQIRSYHPWGYLNDETAFQPEAGDCYDESLAAAQKIILNSSAGPGWLADFKNDIQSVNED